MSNPLFRKLEVANALTDDDRQVLKRVCSRTRRVEAKVDIIQQGDPPSDVHLVLDGLAFRYKILPEGKRQIVALLVPGDFCDLHVAILGAMDHSIAAMTACTIVDIPAVTIRELTEHHPRIARALWWATLVDEGTLREWVTGLGQRDAAARLAHFFCEMLIRLRTVGLADENGYELPLTQTDLADLHGLTSVHVNRTLQELRGSGLITLQGRRVTIPDVARLEEFCDFDPAYLHLASRRSETDVAATMR